MVCGYPCGRVMKNGHPGNPLTLWNAFVSVQLHILSDPLSVQLGNITKTTKVLEETLNAAL